MLSKLQPIDLRNQLFAELLKLRHIKNSLQKNPEPGSYLS